MFPDCLSRSAQWAAALLMLACSQAQAAPTEPAVGLEAPTVEATEEQTVRPYNLPAGDLAESLRALARQAGLTLSVAPDLVADRSAPAVVGVMSTEQALQRLVAGQGLNGRIDTASIIITRAGGDGGQAEAAPQLAVGAPPRGERLRTLNVTSTTASGTAKDLASAPASVSVITQDDLAGTSYRDLTDALQAVPGVYVDDGAAGRGGNQEISIRGWDPEYTKILVDGIPQGSRQGYYNGNGSGSEYGWLPPAAAIERIEVIRGPMSSLYGSDAMGGVINVITRPVPAEWSGSVNVDRVIQDDSRSGDTNNAQYYLSGPLVDDRLSLTFYGGRYDREEDEIEGAYQDYTRQNNTLQMAWTPNQAHQLEVEAGYSSQDSTGTDARTGDEFILERNRQHQSVSHRLDWGGGMRTTSYVQHELMDNKSQNATYERYSADTSTVVPLGRQVVTLGAHFRQQETRNPSRALGKSDLKRYDMALFGEHEWFISEPFALTTGLRYVDDENYGSEFVPRLYGVYGFTPQFTLKGGVSAGYRTPDLKEGDSAWLEGGGGPSLPGGRDVGNSELKPEESLAYEIGAYWTGFNGVNASLTAYHTDYDNKIEKPIICDRTPDGNGGFLYNCPFQGELYQALYQYMNVDEAELQGVEASMGFPVGPRLRVDTSYTFTDSEQLTGDNAGEPLNNQPRHRANVSLTWQANAATRLWSRARYKGNTRYFGRGGPDDGTAPSYTVVDGGARFAATEYLSLYGGVYNIFDENLTTVEYGRIIDGRRYSLGTTLTF